MSTATVAFSKDEATAQCESPTAMKLYDKRIFVAMINTRSMTMNGKEVTRKSVSRMDSAEKDAMEQLAKATDAAILAYRSGLNLYEAKRDVNGELQLSPGLVPVSNLVQVQREILAADMVELADNGPLYNCPKALDRVRVRRAINGSEEIALGIDSRVVDAAMSPCCTDQADWRRELGGVGRRPLS
jgi:hypothetical protein